MEGQDDIEVVVTCHFAVGRRLIVYAPRYVCLLFWGAFRVTLVMVVAVQGERSVCCVLVIVIVVPVSFRRTKKSSE